MPTYGRREGGTGDRRVHHDAIQKLNERVTEAQRDSAAVGERQKTLEKQVVATDGQLQVNCEW